MALPGGTVTFLLTDVVDSARAWQERPDETAKAIAAIERLANDVVARNDGHVIKSRGEGDSSFCVFASASRAVTAAVELQLKLTTQPLKVRIGLHTGDAELRDDDYYGVTPSKCARIRSVAAGGQILCSHVTATVANDLARDISLRDLGAVRLRSFEEPERVSQVCHADLPTEFAPIDAHDTLPAALTTFVGRDNELKEIKDAFARSRLVTLTGAGGSGKSRLAVEASRGLDYPGGVWFVDLAPVSEPVEIPKQIAAALTLTPALDVEAMLTEALNSAPALVILDNCEHQIDAVARLAERLLQSCRGLRLLPTSREPLGIAGEIVIRVPSLTTEDAVHLFADRAQAFALTPQTENTVGEICRRLDGLPLAIELAAARAGVIPIDEVLRGLDDRFALLTSGGRTALSRQRTLEASVDWSYELLGEDERGLLRVLSVFVDTFSLDAVRALAPRPDVAVDALVGLVSKSLIQPIDVHTLPRYRLLDTIRFYAQRKLVESGEQDAALHAHARYYRGLAQDITERMAMLEQTVGLITTEAELGNLRAAAEHTLAHGEPTDALPILPALWLTALDPRREERSWVQRVLDATPDGPPEARFWGYLYLMSIAWNMQAFSEAVASHRESRAIREAVTDPIAKAFGECITGSLYSLSSLTKARAAHDRAEEFARDEVGYPGIIYMRGGCEGTAGDRAEAKRLLMQTMALAGDDPSLIRTLAVHVGALVAIDLGELDLAGELADEAVDLVAQLPPNYLLSARAAPIEVALIRGDVERARALYGAHRSLARPDSPSKVRDGYIRMRLAMWDGDPEAALAAVTHLPNPFGFTTQFIGLDHVDVALATGNADAAEEFVGLSEATLTTMDDDTFQMQRATTKLCRARLHLAAGDAGATIDAARDALSSIEASHAYLGGPDALRILGVAFASAGDAQRGARLAAAGEAMRARIGAALPPYRVNIDHLVEHTDDWTAGSAMTWEEAVAYAQRGRGERKRPASGWASLTPTEAQVVDLVAGGLSNKEVSERLFMSVPTVKSHLTHSYAKLGLASRAELIAAAASH